MSLPVLCPEGWRLARTGFRAHSSCLAPARRSLRPAEAVESSNAIGVCASKGTVKAGIGAVKQIVVRSGPTGQRASTVENRLTKNNAHLWATFLDLAATESQEQAPPSSEKAWKTGRRR